MHPDAVILLVEDDPLVRALFHAVLRAEGSFRVEVAEEGHAALALALAMRPDLIVSDVDLPGMDGLELCRRLRAEPALEGAMYLVVTGITDPDVRSRALDLGVDDVLLKPVDALALTAKVRAMCRLKRLGDRLRADGEEVRRLHGALAAGFDQLLALLVHLLDVARPGAAERGRRLAASALRLADRFEVPAEFRRDLELAALLHEVGLLADPGARDAEHPWRHAVAARLVLRDVERLEPAATLIGALGEHWDGTGQPDRLRQGQIPLRARIVRVLADHQALLDGAGARPPQSPEAALAALAARAGTWYDPAVVAQLDEMLREAPATLEPRRRAHLAIESLAPGMVLAEDLCTNTGTKLLARDATVTAGTIALIHRRHAADPILAGAWVRVDEGGA
jgi:putative two-component system response regulator